MQTPAYMFALNRTRQSPYEYHPLLHPDDQADLKWDNEIGDGVINAGQLATSFLGFTGSTGAW